MSEDVLVDSASEAVEVLSVSDNNGVSSEPSHPETTDDIDAVVLATVDNIADQDDNLHSVEASPAPASSEAVEEQEVEEQEVEEQEASIADPSTTLATDEDMPKEETSTAASSQIEVTQDVEETKFCQVCCEVQSSALFPSRLPTSTCKHAAEVCRLCLEKSTAEQMDQKIWDQIDCPTCPERMTFLDVKEFADTVTFEKYDQLALQAFLKSSGHFQECRHEGCSSGQLLHPEKDNYMICVACSQRTCFKCDVPWHCDMTCEEYQASRVQQETVNSQIEASENYISTQCKLCPNCKAPSKKETGCDHVRCDICEYQYCWGCLADYQKIRESGNDAHLTECQWRPENLPDPPADVVAQAQNS